MLSAELVVIATVVVLGLIAGLRCVQTAVVGELKDVAGAIDSLNQSYYYTGMHGCWKLGCCQQSFTRGSAFFDEQDTLAVAPCDFGLQTVPTPHVIESECPGDIPCPPGEVSDGELIDGPDSAGLPECPSGCDEDLPAAEADSQRLPPPPVSEADIT